MSRPEIPRFRPAINQTAPVPIMRPDMSPAFESAQQFFNQVANIGQGMSNAINRLAIVSERVKSQERDAYLADLETSDILNTNRIYNENVLAGNKPEVLSEKLKGYMDGKLQELPEPIKPYYKKTFEKRAASVLVTAQNEYFQQTEINAKKSLIASLDILKDDIFANPSPKTEIERTAYEEKLQKFNMNLQSQIDNNYITSEEAEIVKKNLQKDLITAAYKSSLENLSDDARAKAILEIQKNDIEGLNINEKQEVISRLSAFDNQIRNVREQAFAKEKADQELSKARKAAELEIRVSRGQASYDEITRMEQNKTITPDQKASLFKTLDQKNNEKLEQMQDLQKVAGAFQGTYYLDPKDAKDKKAIDFTYETAIKQQNSQRKKKRKKRTLTNLA